MIVISNNKNTIKHNAYIANITVDSVCVRFRITSTNLNLVELRVHHTNANNAVKY